MNTDLMQAELPYWERLENFFLSVTWSASGLAHALPFVFMLCFVHKDCTKTKLHFPDVVVFEESYLQFLNLDPEFTQVKQVVQEIRRQNLVAKIYRLLPYDVKHRARHYLYSIVKISESYGMDPLWMTSIAWTESHFKTNSVSSVGAQGLMQIMPKTQKFLDRKMAKSAATLKRPYSVEIPFSRSFYESQLKNIHTGIYYLSQLKKRFSQLKLATVAYNMGPTWTRRRLRKRLPVGKRNQYLDKVSKSYQYIVKRL